MDIHGCNALHFAAKANAVNCIEALVTSGINVNSSDAILKTPLHYAAADGNCDAVEKLV
jgi:ankyrin repeat protein